MKELDRPSSHGTPLTRKQYILNLVALSEEVGGRYHVTVEVMHGHYVRSSTERGTTYEYVRPHDGKNLFPVGTFQLSDQLAHEVREAAREKFGLVLYI